MASVDMTVRRGYLTVHRGGGVSARLNEGGGTGHVISTPVITAPVPLSHTPTVSFQLEFQAYVDGVMSRGG